MRSGRRLLALHVVLEEYQGLFPGGQHGFQGHTGPFGSFQDLLLEHLAARRQALFENDQDLDRRPKRMKMQRLREETDAGPAAVLA